MCRSRNAADVGEQEEVNLHFAILRRQQSVSDFGEYQMLHAMVKVIGQFRHGICAGTHSQTYSVTY